MKVSISQLSDLTGRDRRFIRSRLADLPSEQGEKGAILYESRDALPALFSSTRLDPGVERARLDAARANLAELALRQKEGELLLASEVESVWSGMILNVRSKLLALPTRLAPELVHIRDQSEIAARLKAVIHECLHEIANEE